MLQPLKNYEAEIEARLLHYIENPDAHGWHFTDSEYIGYRDGLFKARAKHPDDTDLVVFRLDPYTFVVTAEFKRYKGSEWHIGTIA